MIDVLLLHTDTVAVGLDNMEDRVVVGIPSDVRVYIQQQQQRHHDLDNDHNKVVVDHNDDWEEFPDDDMQRQLLAKKQSHIKEDMLAY